MTPQTRGRCRAVESVECSSLAAANRIRAEYGDCVVPCDDAREKTVRYCGDAPAPAQQALECIAYESHQQERKKSGQIPLTQFERSQIDFSRTNVFHARACKALSGEFSVEDWLARYDHTLTVSEHVEIYRRAGRSPTAGGPTMREVAPRAGWSA
jgi:hypothetical protein